MGQHMARSRDAYNIAGVSMNVNAEILIWSSKSSFALQSDKQIVRSLSIVDPKSGSHVFFSDSHFCTG
jgi:hypothetical protein